MLFKKKKVDYEKIIKERIKKLEETRLEHFNKSQKEFSNIMRGEVDAYSEMNYHVSCMNQYTYEIQLLRDILEEARA